MKRLHQQVFSVSQILSKQFLTETFSKNMFFREISGIFWEVLWPVFRPTSKGDEKPAKVLIGQHN